MGAGGAITGVWIVWLVAHVGLGRGMRGMCSLPLRVLGFVELMSTCEAELEVAPTFEQIRKKMRVIREVFTSRENKKQVKES